MQGLELEFSPSEEKTKNQRFQGIIVGPYFKGLRD